MPWTDSIKYYDSTLSKYVTAIPAWHGITVHDNATYPLCPGRTSLRTTTISPNGTTYNLYACRADYCGKYLWFGQTADASGTTRTLFRMNPLTQEIVSAAVATSGSATTTFQQCICYGGKVYLLMGGGTAAELWEVASPETSLAATLLYTITTSSVATLFGCIVLDYFYLVKASGAGFYVNVTNTSLNGTLNVSIAANVPLVKYDGINLYAVGSQGGTKTAVSYFAPAVFPVVPTVKTASDIATYGTLSNFTDGGDGYLYCINTSGAIIKYNKTTFAFSLGSAMDGVTAIASAKTINGLIYALGDDTTNKVGRLRIFNPKTGSYRNYDSAIAGYADTTSIVNTGKYNWIFCYSSDGAKNFAVYRMSAFEPPL